MFESCLEIRNHFSDYLDGECPREILRSVRYHLAGCASCRRELEAWQAVQDDLRALPRVQVPAEESLKLRVNLSRQLHQHLLEQLRVRLENILEPLLLPASAGVLTAVLCFGIIMGSQFVPSNRVSEEQAQANTPPQLRVLPPLDFNTGDQAVTLVTHIDSGGRVTEYQLLSGQQSPDLMNRLDRMMYFSVFRPATMSGRPTDGRVVLSLRRITVRG
jgi:hypothetical protein